MKNTNDDATQVGQAGIRQAELFIDVQDRNDTAAKIDYTQDLGFDIGQARNGDGFENLMGFQNVDPVDTLVRLEN